MKVNFDQEHLFHLIVLLCGSLLLACLLHFYLEWTILASLVSGTTIISQINSHLMKQHDGNEEMVVEQQRKREARQARRRSKP